jgi:hypothetical protein
MKVVHYAVYAISLGSFALFSLVLMVQGLLSSWSGLADPYQAVSEGSGRFWMGVLLGLLIATFCGGLLVQSSMKTYFPQVKGPFQYPPYYHFPVQRS